MQIQNTSGQSNTHPLFRPSSAKGSGTSTLSVWIPLFLGAVLAVAGAFLLLQRSWIPLLGLLLIVPALILFFKYPFIAVFIWLLIFPFFVKEILPGARMMYWVLHRVMIPGALLVLIGLSLTGLKRIKPLRLGLVDGLMVVYLVYSVANIVLLSVQPISQLIRFYDRIFVPFCMYWLIRVLNPDKADLQRLAPLAFLIIFSQGAIGMLSWFAPGVLPKQWLGRLGERTTGTFGNPGVFSTTMMFCAVLLVQGYWQAARRMNWKLFSSLIAVGMAFFFVFFSFSRGSWLGALPVWLGLYVLYPKVMLRLTLLGSLILAPLLAIGPLANYSTFAENRLVTESTAEGRVLGGAASSRMIAAKPVTGWGYGNHELFDEQFRDRTLGLAANKQQSSHNTYLLIAAEMGIPGLLLYFLPAAWLLFLTLRYRRWLPQLGVWSRSMALMLWLLVLDHLLVGLFTDMIQSNFFNTVLYWLILALIANIVESGRSAAASHRLSHPIAAGE